MPCIRQPVVTCCGIAQAPFAAENPGGSLVAEGPAQYRPRHPERSAFYQLFEDHFDSYVRGYEERFEPRSGPLRTQVYLQATAGLLAEASQRFLNNFRQNISPKGEGI